MSNIFLELPYWKAAVYQSAGKVFADPKAGADAALATSSIVFKPSFLESNGIL